MKPAQDTTCPVARVASLLSDAWTMLIIRDLMEGPMRFGELHESLDGISTRTLTQKLEKLSACGIIQKNRTVYSITSKGKKLDAVIGEMRRFGKKYLPA